MKTRIFLRLPEVCKRTGLSRSRLYEIIGDGQFAPGVPIGEKARAWPAEEVEELQRRQLALSVERHPLAAAVREIVMASGGTWRGTAQDLLVALRRLRALKRVGRAALPACSDALIAHFPQLRLMLARIEFVVEFAEPGGMITISRAGSAADAAAPDLATA